MKAGSGPAGGRGVPRRRLSAAGPAVHEQGRGTFARGGPARRCGAGAACREASVKKLRAEAEARKTVAKSLEQDGMRDLAALEDLVAALDAAPDEPDLYVPLDHPSIKRHNILTMKEITYNNQKKEIPDSPGGVIPQGVLPLPGVGINDERGGRFLLSRCAASCFPAFWG